MKKIISFILSIIIAFPLSIVSFANDGIYTVNYHNDILNLTLDAKMDENEWYNYSDTYTEILNSENSSNNIEHAGFMYALDESSNELWLLFDFYCKKDKTSDISNMGIGFGLDNSIDGGASVTQGNPYLASGGGTGEDGYYDYVGLISAQRDNSVVAEYCVSYDKQRNCPINFSVVFYDDEGNGSLPKAITLSSSDVLIDDTIDHIIISVPSDLTIYYKQTVILEAFCDSYVDGYDIAWFDGNTRVSEYNDLKLIEVSGTKTYTAKLVDSSGNVVSTDGQNQSVTINVKNNFFDKIVAIFLRLFGKTTVYASGTYVQDLEKEKLDRIYI